MRSDTRAKLMELVANAKDSNDLLQNLKTHLDELREGIITQSISPGAEKQLEGLLGLTEHIANAAAQRRFLNSLAFEGMRGRVNTVEQAHFDTFQWVFQSDADTEDHENLEYTINKDANLEEEGKAKSAARALFNNWLLSGTDIFHVSGKIGAGKSTLMKYLCAHPETEAKLTTWAGASNRAFS